MKVSYKDHFGSDSSVVDAARVSFAKGASGYTDEQNKRLIKYLSDHNHKSPFFHTAVTLHMKMPIFVARQIMKHTVGIEYNEVSRRYVDSEPEFYVPDVWRKRADNVKQGSSDEAVDSKSLTWTCPEDEMEGVYQKSLDAYRELIYYCDVAPEQARMILPQSMYTEVIATGNLYAFANMYNQRTDSHAQKETQEIAKQIGEIIEPLYPESWKALTQ
jgi:thymidylate synthase (FAD)